MQMDILGKAEEMLRPNNYRLAYLTKFGSHLYGTATATSDTDYKGLFWPSIDDLILQKKCNSISFSTGDNASRNTSEDFDIQFWSVQYWISLVHKGDTNAIDLLFSMFADTKVTSDQGVKDLLGEFYTHPIDLIGLKENTAYVSYAYMQAKKYGLKGSKLDFLKRARDWFAERLDEETQYMRLEKYFDAFLHDMASGDSMYCVERETNNERCLYINGKGFPASVKLGEAVRRLENEYKKYGVRSEMALHNQGIDWKACSHALRACYQIIELAETGFLHYPLKDAPKIMEVKAGRLDWKTEVEPLIVELLEIAKSKLEKLETNYSVIQNGELLIRSYYSQFLK